MDFNVFQQHFMVNQEILAKIVQLAELKKNDLVLEIGAGSGNLTKELAKNCSVIVVEIDANFKEELESIPNTKVYIDNFLKFRIQEKFNKIVSNIPYNLCEPLLWKLIRMEFEFTIFTVPNKFLNSLNDKTSKLIYFKDIYKIEELLDVPKESFSPVPRTDSVVIKIIKKEKDNSLIQSLLYQYDKILKNALIEYLSIGSTKNKAKESIKDFEKNILKKRITELSKKELEYIIPKIDTKA